MTTRYLEIIVPIFDDNRGGLAGVKKPAAYTVWGDGPSRVIDYSARTEFSNRIGFERSFRASKYTVRFYPRDNLDGKVSSFAIRNTGTSEEFVVHAMWNQVRVPSGTYEWTAIEGREGNSVIADGNRKVPARSA